MKVDNYVKHALLKYPTLYKNRADVLCHVFAVIGNGLEWENGQLTGDGFYSDDVPTDEKVEAEFYSMRYDDLDEKNKKEFEHDCLKDLYLCYQINNEYERMRRALTEKYIDHIAKDVRAAVTTHFTSIKGHYIDRPCENYARLFTVPDDVNEDWGLAAIEFAKLWRQHFMNKYTGFSMFSKDKEPAKWLDRYINNWPQEMKIAYKFVARLQIVMDDICTKIGIETESSKNPTWSKEMAEALDLPL